MSVSGNGEPFLSFEALYELTERSLAETWGAIVLPEADESMIPITDVAHRVIINNAKVFAERHYAIDSNLCHLVIDNCVSDPTRAAHIAGERPPTATLENEIKVWVLNLVDHRR